MDLNVRRGPAGAYGLRLLQVDDAVASLGPALPEWPELRIERRIGRLDAFAESVGESVARIRLRDGGGIRLTRSPATASFTLPRAVDAHELVHPLLASAAAVVAHWEGRESFHAGAFRVGDHVWGVIGGRGAGKSTTMAQLALAGVPVVADDLLVVEHGMALAGPRCVDLREEPAAALGAGEPLGIVGNRRRWRLQLDAVEPAAPLAGWVFLDWGERTEHVRVPAHVRLRRLHAERALRIPPLDPAVLVDLAALPGWTVRRPRGLQSLEGSADLILSLAS